MTKIGTKIATENGKKSFDRIKSRGNITDVDSIKERREKLEKHQEELRKSRHDVVHAVSEPGVKE